MTRTRSDLIYDVGVLNGDDTAYYLYRGYEVVAIDANPVMIESARVRFAKEIQNGRVTLLNVGIAKNSGKELFWISDHSEWSSFNRGVASRGGTGHRSVVVPVVPLTELVAQYGVPHYLKVDIEGNDGLCIDALREGVLPTYISVESECIEDAAVLSDEEATKTLKLLRDVGYRRFKLVKQLGWRVVRSNRAAHLLKRVVTSLAIGRLKVRGVAEIASRFTDAARYTATLGYDFPPGSSGPWGDDILGDWMSFAEAKDVYMRERRSHFRFRSKVANYSFWYDWHATY
jgi:FkbM family methyltransferase